MFLIVVLDLGEAGLAGIKIRTIGDVVEALDALLLQLLPDNVGLVDREVINEDGDLLELVRSAESKKVFGELFFVHRLLKYLVMLHASLLRDGEDESKDWLVHCILWNLQVLSGLGIDLSLDRLGGKDRLVHVDDAVVLSF